LAKLVSNGVTKPSASEYKSNGPVPAPAVVKNI